MDNPGTVFQGDKIGSNDAISQVFIRLLTLQLNIFGSLSLVFNGDKSLALDSEFVGIYQWFIPQANQLFPHYLFRYLTVFQSN